MRKRFTIPYKSVKDKNEDLDHWYGIIWIDEKKYSVIAARNEGGWEHVSVASKPGQKLPSWETLTKIKECFWNDDEDVIHWIPKTSEYVNMHPNCMHLWRIINTDMSAELDRLATERSDKK